MRYRQTFLVLLLCFKGVNANAQQLSDAVKIGDVTVSGWLRTRAEAWDWFQGNANNEYAFSESLFRLGFTRDAQSFDWKIEVAVPFLLGLPSDAIAPSPQGQMGFGGNYYANSRAKNTASLFPKQVYGKWKFGERWKQSVLVGRSEFFDGTEGKPVNATVSALKRDRIAQRLIGNFAFADVGRSFDGGVYSIDGEKTDITVFAARPTRGVYQVDGWGEVDTSVYYGSLTHETGNATSGGEWRVFGLGYNDFRGSVLKTDNRSQAARTADQGTIDIATAGADYLYALQTPAGTFEVLLWGVLQGGSWGNLTQRAYAYATEAGWQAPVASAVKPWLRGGYSYGSGDKNPTDNVHGTFFQVLPTARQYARFPFFNMMNNRDAFGELVLRPSKAVTARIDVHSLALASSKDLLYNGGGVYQPWTFGYTGRPSYGQSGLATLYDASLDYTVNQHFAFAAYYARAQGKLVLQDIYPKGRNANFGYLEANYRF